MLSLVLVCCDLGRRAEGKLVCKQIFCTYLHNSMENLHRCNFARLLFINKCTYTYTHPSPPSLPYHHVYILPLSFPFPSRNGWNHERLLGLVCSVCFCFDSIILLRRVKQSRRQTTTTSLVSTDALCILVTHQLSWLDHSESVVFLRLVMTLK